MRKYVTATHHSLTRVEPSALCGDRLDRGGGVSSALEGGLAAVLLSEEPLELLAKLVGGRQLCVVGEQPLSCRAGKGVVLLFHRVDDRTDLVRLGDLSRDLRLRLADGGIEAGDPQVETRRALDVGE